MGTTLATPSFIGGAKDTMATADIYKLTSTATINSIQEATPTATLDAAVALRGGPNLKSSLKTIVDGAKSAKDYLSIGQNLFSTAKGLVSGSALSRLNAAGNLLSGPIGVLNTSTKNSILGSVRDVSGIISNVGGFSKQISNGNLGNVNSLNGLLNGVSGIANLATITDTKSNIGALTGIVKTASGIGMPDSFGALMRNVQDINIVNSVAKNVADDIVLASDTSSLKSMGELTSPGSLLLSNPDVLTNFSQKYKSPPGIKAGDKLADYTNVKEAFSLVKPDWNTTTLHSSTGAKEQAVDLTIIQAGSKDTLDLFKNGSITSPDSFDKLMTLAPVFPPTTVNSELKNQFPRTNFNLNASTTVSPINSGKEQETGSFSYSVPLPERITSTAVTVKPNGDVVNSVIITDAYGDIISNHETTTKVSGEQSTIKIQ